MTRARLDPEAEVELREAAAWYAERSPDVARRFLEGVREAVRTAATSPGAFPVLQEPRAEVPIRRALVRGFPYAVVFLTTGGETHVLAVAHVRRQPGYWLDRIERAPR